MAVPLAPGPPFSLAFKALPPPLSHLTVDFCQRTVRGGPFSGSLPCTIKCQLHVGFSLDFSSHKPPFPWKMKDRCDCIWHYHCMLRVLGGKTNIKYYLPPEWFPSKELSNLAICTRMKILQPSIPVPTNSAPAFLSISPHLPKPQVSLMYCSSQYLSPSSFLAQ